MIFFCSVFANLSSRGQRTPRWRGVKMAHVAITIKNRNLNSLKDKEKTFAKCLKRPNHVITPRRFCKVPVVWTVACPQPNTRTQEQTGRSSARELVYEHTNTQRERRQI